MDTKRTIYPLPVGLIEDVHPEKFPLLDCSELPEFKWVELENGRKCLDIRLTKKYNIQETEYGIDGVSTSLVPMSGDVMATIHLSDIIGGKVWSFPVFVSEDHTIESATAAHPLLSALADPAVSLISIKLTTYYFDGDKEVRIDATIIGIQLLVQVSDVIPVNLKVEWMTTSPNGKPERKSFCFTKP